MKIEDRLKKILSILDARFVAFVTETGDLISSLPDKPSGVSMDIIISLIRTVIMTEKAEQTELREILCTGLSSRIAMARMKYESLKGFLVVGMGEDFDILAMRGVLRQVGG